MSSERIYVFDGGNNDSNRRLGRKVRRYDLDTFLEGVREGFTPELYDEVTIECKRSQYDYSFPVVTCFIATDIPKARADFLHYCKVLGHCPKDCSFVTLGSGGHLISTHRSIDGALERAAKDGTFADFYPLED